MVINEISFDVWKNNYIMVYACKGEVNARSIVATFRNEDGYSLDLTGKSVTFYALKPDGTKIYNSCTVDEEDKTATINLTSQAVNVAGIVNCEYQIFSGNTLLLKVKGLKIVVEDGGDFTEAVESSSEYNTLISAINEAETFSESVGLVSDLTTTNKSNVVAAINELNSKTIPISHGGTGGTTETAARTNLGVMKNVSLYSNSSGTASTITLSDSIANYKAIEIFYMEDDYDGPWRDSLKIWCNESSSVSATLSSMFARVYSSNNQVKLFAANVYLSGTSLTWGYAKMATLTAGNTQSVTDLAQYSSHKVYKVVGYKY